MCRFESTITGQFFGHTHQDSWQVFFDDSNRTRATKSVGLDSPHITIIAMVTISFRANFVNPCLHKNCLESTATFMPIISTTLSYYNNAQPAFLFITLRPPYIKTSKKDTSLQRTLDPTQFQEAFEMVAEKRVK